MNKSPLIFVHIPKTAGTSFRIAIESQIKQNLICRDYGVDSPATSSIVKKYIYESNDRESFRKSFDEKSYIFMTGHFHAEKYVNFFDKSQFITFLRDPIARVISEYNHKIRDKSISGSLRDFYRNAGQINRQKNILESLEIGEYGFFGITEDYERSIDLFNRQYDFSIQKSMLNVAEREQYYIPTEQEYEELQILNREDISFYNEAKTEFNSRYLEEDQLKIDRLKVDKLAATLNFQNGIIHGWAAYENNKEEIAKIKIRINNDRIYEVFAKNYRSDIKKLKIKRSGCAGFKMNTNTLDVTSVKSIELLDQDDVLIKSILI